ncbi:putative set domain-containing protein [Phytophthora cinnamomi]|uniref:putative set domain-containing protein n=1 Tax=Phytophthora cinnamomi TaxID=4785 RepID=UPI00355939DF|nr:putative set domain-containing protein [Phytophthora cinnamomi]
MRTGLHFMWTTPEERAVVHATISLTRKQQRHNRKLAARPRVQHSAIDDAGPPQALHAGDVIEYFSRAFVWGDSRGFRRAVVTSVDGGSSGNFPISVDTAEAMPTDTMVKLIKARSSKLVAGLWRKQRTFRLLPGTFVAPNRAGALKTALEGAVTAACEAVREALEDACGEIVPETPQSSVCSSPDRVSGSEDVHAPSVHDSANLAPPHSGGAFATSWPNAAREESFVRSSVDEIVGFVSSEEDRELQVASAGDQPSSVSDRKAAAYMRAIPNRHARDKIRHQASKKRAQWHVPRSRKRRHLAKCAIPRSGSVIYHAKAFKPVKFEALMKSPEVMKEVEKLHDRRRSYEEPSSKKGYPYCRTVQWPDEVGQLTTCKRNGVKFPDIGSFNPCSCFGDCFLDTCSNVASASVCTPNYCKLGARCSNAPRTLDTLKLFDTGRVGLSVYTTTALDVGDVIGEYCAELTEFAASLKPNAAFVEQQTRSRVRVLVKMLKNVKAGAQVTVHYGNERWFKCACDGCWVNRTEIGGDSEEE